MTIEQFLKERLEGALAYQVERRFSEAQALYEEVLEKVPNHPDALHFLGLVRLELGFVDEARDLMEQAISVFPHAAHYHHNLATLYQRLGKLKEAEARFRNAIQLNPQFGEAYQGLSQVITYSAGDGLLDDIDKQLKNGKLHDSVRSYFHFAAGKFLDDVGNYQQAFAHYKAGNALVTSTFDPQGHDQRVNAIIAIYNQETVTKLSQPGIGIESSMPTFVLGMPRSGTTLIEQILASHSQVFGAGEIGEIPNAIRQMEALQHDARSYPECVTQIAGADYQKIADDYLQKTIQMAGSNKFLRIVDKRPLNFRHVGLIKTMFPNAKIIHAVRHPLDTLLSCFFQHFANRQDYSFDLMSLGRFYLGYKSLMDHWERVYPGQILTIRYEQMVAEQESETRRLLEHVELPFEAGCLSFHETDRHVDTVSFVQVRQPIYQSSRNRWHNYRDELAELAMMIGVDSV